MATRPETTWEMLNEAMSHFQEHIRNKKLIWELSLTDLLHVSNFKGGNASITEPMATLPPKLKQYEIVLRDIETTFKKKGLNDLTEEELTQLTGRCTDFLALTTKPKSKIRGLGPSYASALLAAHFINLIPVLDRRVLNGAAISVTTQANGQVKDIAKHYAELIKAFRAALRLTPEMSLRELDKKWFIKSL
ncbi:hypothetical protein [Pseudomonas sp. BGI-2]|uniref:hypothetical protein n=1 Tax=Pseudomonas sp. BGI-2 TaxID=2528211 RepID=UPI0010338B38|nr:hypothetical protein [Pseudomonas sp. BGI-2]TBN37942.1 hypothetical protein EYC95_22530 [Pseudomonas sp. BGI-2]